MNQLTNGFELQKETLSTRLQFLATIAPSQRLLQLLDYDFVAVNLPIDSADNIYHSSRFLGLKEHLGPNPEFVKCARVDKEGFLQVGSNPWVLRVDVIHLTKDELNKFKEDVCETLTRYGHVCYPSTLDKVLSSTNLQVHPAELMQAIVDARPEVKSILAIGYGMKTPTELWQTKFNTLFTSVPTSTVRCPNQFDISFSAASNHLYSFLLPACPPNLPHVEDHNWSCVTYPMSNVVDPFPKPDAMLGGTATITFKGALGSPVHPNLASVKVYNHLYHYTNAVMPGNRKEIETVQQYNDCLAALKRLNAKYQEIPEFGFGLRIEARIIAPTVTAAVRIFNDSNLEDPFSLMSMMNLPPAKRVMYAIPRQYFLNRVASVLQLEEPLALGHTRKIGKELRLRMNDFRNMMNLYCKGNRTPQHGPNYWWSPIDSDAESESESESDQDSDYDNRNQDIQPRRKARALPVPNIEDVAPVGGFIDQLPVVPRRKRGQFSDEEDAAILRAVEDAERDGGGNIQWKRAAYPLLLTLLGANTAISMEHMKNRYKTLQTSGVPKRQKKNVSEDEADNEDAQADEEAMALGFNPNEESESEDEQAGAVQEDEESEVEMHGGQFEDFEEYERFEEEEEDLEEYGGGDEYDNYSMPEMEFIYPQEEKEEEESEPEGELVEEIMSLGSGETPVVEYWGPGEDLSIGESVNESSRSYSDSDSASAREADEIASELSSSDAGSDTSRWALMERDPYEADERHHRLVFYSNEEYDMGDEEESG